MQPMLGLPGHLFYLFAEVLLPLAQRQPYGRSVSVRPCGLYDHPSQVRIARRNNSSLLPYRSYVAASDLA